MFEICGSLTAYDAGSACVGQDDHGTVCRAGIRLIEGASTVGRSSIGRLGVMIDWVCRLVPPAFAVARQRPLARTTSG